MPVSVRDIHAFKERGERFAMLTAYDALSARLLTGHEAIRPQSRGSSAEHLDDRQRLVLRLVSLGWSNKEIALELNLQEKTIKHQLTRIYAMLDVNNRTEAAMVFRNTDDEPYSRESSRSRA